MRLAVLSAPRRLEVVDVPVPEPGLGEVLLRVASCAVCASELDMWEGAAGIDYLRFPGHEVSGTVERLGPGVNRFSRGDPIAAWVTGRGFAEYVAVRAEYYFSAGSVPLDIALAEPLACAVNAVELAAPALGDDVAPQRPLPRHRHDHARHADRHAAAHVRPLGTRAGSPIPASRTSSPPGAATRSPGSRASTRVTTTTARTA